MCNFRCKAESAAVNKEKEWRKKEDGEDEKDAWKTTLYVFFL